MAASYVLDTSSCRHALRHRKVFASLRLAQGTLSHAATSAKYKSDPVSQAMKNMFLSVGSAPG